MGAPKREVIAIIGDGGFQMTIQELGTIFQMQEMDMAVVTTYLVQLLYLQRQQ